MNSSVIICATICITLISIYLIGKIKGNRRPESIQYKMVVTPKDSLYRTLNDLSEKHKEIVGVTLDYSSQATIGYLIIYKEAARDE